MANATEAVAAKNEASKAPQYTTCVPSEPLPSGADR